MWSSKAVLCTTFYTVANRGPFTLRLTLWAGVCNVRVALPICTEWRPRYVISTLWSKTAKNTDRSTGPLARLFARSHRSLVRSCPPLRSLVCSLAHSLARGKEVFVWNERVDLIQFQPTPNPVRVDSPLLKSSIEFESYHPVVVRPISPITLLFMRQTAAAVVSFILFHCHCSLSQKMFKKDIYFILFN